MARFAKVLSRGLVYILTRVVRLCKLEDFKEPIGNETSNDSRTAWRLNPISGRERALGVWDLLSR